MNKEQRMEQHENPEKSDNELPEEEQEVPSEEEIPEQKYEIQKIETLKDFVDILKIDYDNTTDFELRKKLAHQIIKIELSIGKVDPPLDMADVKVEKLPNGVLGHYVPSRDEIAIDHDMLSDFATDQKLITHVLVHENLHKQGISDEGMVELYVKRLITPVPGIYVDEQRQARATFRHVGMGKALDLYDIENPDELINYYLEIEMENEWKNAFRDQTLHEFGESDEEIKDFLIRISRQKLEKIEDDFELGSERLYHKLEDRGFDIKKTSVDFLEKLAKDDFAIRQMIGRSEKKAA